MELADLYHKIRGHRVTTDSRDIQAGDVFIALKGENFDGNRYAAEAIQKGATLAVIDNPAYMTNNCQLVRDSLTFLQELARYHRRYLGIPLLGITGTNGKTTTKELCHAVLSRKFKTYATQGNFNNHIGVPLTLLSMDETTEFGIVEMGANHPGEIKTLCDIAEPDYGIITNIGQAHLEGFGSPENIIVTKRALYDHILNKNGKVFVNASDELLMNLSKNHNRNTYGKGGDLLQGEIKQTVPYLVYSILAPKGQLYIKTHLVGGYNFDNAMAASAIGFHFGIDPLEIQAAIENYHPSNLRSQLIRTENNTIILDAYNANPSSMKVAIANFTSMPVSPKAVILGDMRELGPASDELHAEAVAEIKAGKFDKVFLCGEHFRKAGKEFATFATTEELIEELKANPLKGYHILIKGSHGMALEKTVDIL